MAKIIRVVRENLPPVRFIGKKYKKFGHWDEWFDHGWFDILEENMAGKPAFAPLGGAKSGLVLVRGGGDGRAPCRIPATFVPRPWNPCQEGLAHAIIYRVCKNRAHPA